MKSIASVVLILTLVGIASATAPPTISSIATPYLPMQQQVSVLGQSYEPGRISYGPAGAPVVISGANFGSSGTVTFRGVGSRVIATLTAPWNATRLSVIVPSDARTGEIQVMTADGQTAISSLPFVVTTGTYIVGCPIVPIPGQLAITTTSLPAGTVGNDYSVSLQASGGQGSYFWTLIGSLPAGLQFTSGGVLSGKPTSPGSSTLTVEVRDAAYSVVSAAFTIAINPGTPSVSGINPTSGPVGTEVEISGSNLGTTAPLGSIVAIGSMVVVPTYWSDMAIRFTVPDTSTGGTVSVTIGGTTMIAGTFTVTGRGTSPTVFLSPSELSLVVGDTYTLDALASDGSVLHGLPWDSSNFGVVELSSDDPPLLIAKAEGSSTITAGAATSTITVYAGPTLPAGTVKWRVPDDVTNGTPQKIIPAVPSATGVADVFTVTSSHHVQAITPDGHIAWTAQPYGSVIADFQGGFIDARNDLIQKFDGQTGQALPAYSRQNWSLNFSFLGVHTDGTVFAVDGDTVVGIDAQTGLEKMPHVRLATQSTTSVTDCPGKTSPPPTTTHWHVGNQPVTVAGDGYLYFNYYVSGSSTTEHCEVSTDANGLVYNHESKQTNSTDEFHLLRLASDGTAQDLRLSTNLSSTTSTDNIDRVQAGTDCSATPLPAGCSETRSAQSSASYWRAYSGMITNADQGVLLLWTEVYTPGSGGGSQTNTAKLTAVLGGQIGTDIPLQGLASPQANNAMKLYLQLQNGDFVALRDNYDNNHDALIAFNAAGEMHWIKPVAQYSTTPLYALADGSMVYTEGFSPNQQLVTLDAGGNELSRAANDGTTYSWNGAYKKGSTLSYAANTPTLVPGFASVLAGNLTGNGTSIQGCDVQIGGTTLHYGPKTPCPFKTDGNGNLVVNTHSDLFLNRTRDCFNGLKRMSDYTLTSKSGASLPATTDIVEHHTNPSVTSSGDGTSTSFGEHVFKDGLGFWPNQSLDKWISSHRVFTVDIQGQTFVLMVHTEQDYLVEWMWMIHRLGTNTQVYVDGTLAQLWQSGCQ